VIFYRCDTCKAEAEASTRTGAKPLHWTIGLGVELCPKCSQLPADEAKERETT